MQEVTVTTEKELKKATDEKIEKIIVKGELATAVQKQYKKKKAGKKIMIGSGIAAGALLLAAPFTGGATLPGAIAAAAGTEGAAAGAAAGATAVYLAAGAGFVSGALLVAIAKDYDIEMVGSDGSAIILKKRK